MKPSSIFILLLFFILASCSVETKKTNPVNDQLIQYIQKRYKTSEVSSIIGSESKKGKTNTSLLITVGKSNVIDSSKSDPQLFASDIAFRQFCDMKEQERKKYDMITVKINQRNKVTEVNYTKEKLLEVNVNLLWLDGFFRLIEEKEYALAKTQFNPKLVDTSTVELESIFEAVHTNLGKLNRHELQGFEIRDIKVDGKTYRVLQANYIFFYDEHYTQAKYAVLMDEPEQKLVNFLIQ